MKYLFCLILLTVFSTLCHAGQCVDPIFYMNSVDANGKPNAPLSLRYNKMTQWEYGISSTHKSELDRLEKALRGSKFVVLKRSTEKRDELVYTLLLGRTESISQQDFEQRNHYLFELAHKYKDTDYDGWKLESLNCNK